VSPGTTIVIGVTTLVVIYGIVGLSLSIKRVPPGHARNVTRLPLTCARWDTEGRQHRALGPGWHLVFPGRDQVSGPIDLRQKALSLDGSRIRTADNASVTVDTTVSFQITDPLAVCVVGNQNDAVEKLLLMMLSQIVGSMGLAQTLAAREEVSAYLRERLTQASATLGIRLNSAEVRSILSAPETGTEGLAGQVETRLGPGEDALAVLLQQHVQQVAEQAQNPGRSASTGAGRGLRILLGVTRPWVLLTAALAFALAVLPFTLRDVGPAWSAHLGHGEPGIFTAYTESCSRSCSWYGDFTANSGYTRTDVLLASGNHVSHVGDEVAAVDAGDPKVVYPSGGGTDWILLTALLAAQATAIICVPVYLLRKLRRRLHQAEYLYDTSS